MARKRISQQPRQTILLVTATEAEALYFSQMRKDCRYSNMTVIWEQDCKDLSSLITTAAKMRNSGNYSSVWVVFGFADLKVSSEDVSKLLVLAEKRKSGLPGTILPCRFGTCCTCRPPRALYRIPK